MFEKLDIPFCNKVLEYAEATQPGFLHRQMTFFCTQDANAEDRSFWENVLKAHNCGTVACLAGVACMLSPSIEMKPMTHHQGAVLHEPFVDGRMVNWLEAAAEVMGLTEKQAHKLFWNFDNEIALDMLRDWIKLAEQEQMGEAK